jgi:hypothetical protein
MHSKLFSVLQMIRSFATWLQRERCMLNVFVLIFSRDMQSGERQASTSDNAIQFNSLRGAISSQAQGN